MVSAVLNKKARRASDTAQMTLSFEPGLKDRFPTLRECVATGVYQRGLTKVAPFVDMAPGNLSVALSDDPTRKFSIDALEMYIKEFGDLTPIYYLVEKYLGEPSAAKDSAMSELSQQLVQMQQLIKRAGLA